MSDLNVGTLVRFLRAIAVLALPAKSQIAWLQSLGLPGEPRFADELALEFDDGYRLLPQFVRNDWLASQVIEPLAGLDTLLEAMSASGNADLWTVEALASSPQWEEARCKARSILMLL